MKPSKRLLFFMLFLLSSAAFAQKIEDKALSKEELELYKDKVESLVSFIQFLLNTVGEKGTPQSERDIIIDDTFAKVFRDEKVQIEDDLVPGRANPINKDVQGYLKDVDFFFRDVRFRFDIQKIENLINEEGKTFFRVTMNRNLSGVNLDGDTINHDMVRFMEVNLDVVRKDLKVVSMYTTRLSEREDLTNWWNSMTQDWKDLIAEGEMLRGVIPINEIRFINDTTLVFDDYEYEAETVEIFTVLKNMASMELLDISGHTEITSLAPLEQMENLRVLRIAGTQVTDLKPIRNLSKLEILDLSNTLINDLSALQYASALREINLSGTLVKDLGPLLGSARLERLYLNQTSFDDFNQLKRLPLLSDLRLNGVQIESLAFVHDLPKLSNLLVSNTNISTLDELSGHPSLAQIFCDNTSISSLEGLKDMPELKRIYMDNTPLSMRETNAFRLRNPGVLIIFQSANMSLWWDNLSASWKEIFNGYVKFEDLTAPKKEELAELGYLAELNLKGLKEIESLEPLRPLIFLQRLNVAATGVKNLGSISDLRDIRSINIAHTLIDDLRPLRLMQNLNSLEAQNSAIQSLAGLEELNELRNINIDSTGVSYFTPLYGLSKLESIRAESTGISSKEAIALWDRIPQVRIIFDTPGISAWFQSLPDYWREIFRSNTNMNPEPSPEQLHALYSRVSIEISPGATVRDLTPITFLPRLRELNAIDVRIQSLEPLRNLSQLQVLRLSRNPIEDIAPLAGLGQLRILELDNTAVEKLEPLQALALLEELRVSGTNVKRINALSQLYQLRFLDISNTRVSNLKPILKTQGLESLRCFNTRLNARRVAQFSAAVPGCDVLFY